MITIITALDMVKVGEMSPKPIVANITIVKYTHSK